MNAEQKYHKKRKGFLLLALALVVVVGIGVLLWSKVQTGEITLGQPTPTATSEYKTTTVRRSDLSVAISGTGTIVTSESVDLRFSVSGTVAEVSVEPGDEVTQGQVLATLGDTAELKQTILDQTLAVKVAEKTLNDLLNGGSAALAQAQADLASAEEAYADAQSNVHYKGDPRCSVSTTQEYYFKYINAKAIADEWESYLNDGNTGYGRDFILQKLTPMRKERDQAYSNYTYCQGYTDQEIEASQADVQLAKAKLDEATKAYDELKASSGIDQAAVDVAQATLDNAILQLAKAQSELAGTTITAPMAGTVTAVNGKAGDDVDTSTFITLADLQEPEVQVNMDETDLENFAVGCAAEVTFDSVPGETFPGTVTQVSPVLVSVSSTNMVQGLVDLQKKEMASGKTLSIGLTASVEVTCKQAKDVLVVPAQALYEPTGQTAYVYVLNDSGVPEKREVAVGLQTIASAEITSGLSEGEKIITSQIESSSTASANQ
jgi:RND family efflux transporter MFP subunit